MSDKRNFHYFLNSLKDDHPAQIGLIESVQDKFEKNFEAITPKEIKALKMYPMQFVKRSPQPEGEWTTKLHEWAEQGVPEILELDPVFLAFKNSYGDSVLMCLVVGSTGAYTEKVNYDLIDKILNHENYTFEDVETDDEDKETIILKSAVDVKDLNNQTIIDYLIDFAFGTNIYKDQDADLKLQELLKEFSEYSKSHEDEKEVIKEKPKIDPVEAAEKLEEVTEGDAEVERESDEVEEIKGLENPNPKN